MKVLFIVPNLLISHRQFAAAPYVSLPLGILSMAAFLRSVGWDGEMEVYDARLSAKRSRNALGEELFGDSDVEMKAFIAASKADVIAISNMFTAQFSRALLVAQLAKEACPDCITVIGGPHVSAFPEESIREPSVDYVVMGEGEERFYYLLESLKIGERPIIQGVLKDESDLGLLRPNPKSRISFLPGIDNLPLPAYDMVDVERYFALQSSGYSPRPREWGKRAVTVITSRGCPHQCIFCSIHTTMGYKWRQHSVEYVMNHIRWLQDRYEIDFIHFEDDNFSHDPERYDKIIDGLLSLDTPIRWDTPNGVRGDTWTRERVHKTKLSGCQYLIVAIESTAQRVIDEVVKKRLDLEQVSELISYCNAEQLRLQAFYVIGMPGETFDEIRGTVDTALRYYSQFGVWPILSIAMPLPGTELHEIVTRRNFHRKQFGYGYGAIETEEFTPEKLNDLYRAFTRKKAVIFVRRSFSSASEFFYNLRLVTQYKRNVWLTALKSVRGLIQAEISSPGAVSPYPNQSP
jgi:radical SAM superfamily enzyme YgiQ (UPF0313 family)